MTSYKTTLFVVTALVAACAQEEPPARSISELVENPILLEAAMVRCAADRVGKRYDQQCINAREAVKRIQAKEEEAGRVELEARSERKRQALRRTQQAAAEARRRSEESERLRKEAEYLAQFGVSPPTDAGASEPTLPEGNLPIAVMPEAQEREPTGSVYGEMVQPTDGGNAPVAESAPDDESEDGTG